MGAIVMPASRREQRKTDRRRAIVDAARASFLDHGYAGTSMSGLLQVLGGSKATLWGYFRSKEELFAAVVEEVSAVFRCELEEVLTLDGELEPVLVAFCRTFIERITAPEAIATWRLVVAESGRFPEVGRIFHERASSHAQAMLADYLTRHIGADGLQAKDPLRMAEVLISLCAGQQTRVLWMADRESAGEPAASAAEFVRVFLCGYAA